jgi:hypothetical protein
MTIRRPLSFVALGIEQLIPDLRATDGGGFEFSAVGLKKQLPIIYSSSLLDGAPQITPRRFCR